MSFISEDETEKTYTGSQLARERSIGYTVGVLLGLILMGLLGFAYMQEQIHQIEGRYTPQTKVIKSTVFLKDDFAVTLNIETKFKNGRAITTELMSSISAHARSLARGYKCSETGALIQKITMIAGSRFEVTKVTIGKADIEELEYHCVGYPGEKK